MLIPLLTVLSSVATAPGYLQAAKAAPISSAPPAGKPAVSLRGQAAPAFTLRDVDGKTHSLQEYRGQTVALYFFCGCGLCHKCAVAWGQVQRGGALVPKATSNASGQAMRQPLTLVVYHGEAPELRAFAAATQLDPKNTVLLTNPEEDVSLRYDADPCPRVFVIDPHGIVRYTNDEQGAESYQIPTPLLVARAVDALRSVSARNVKTTAMPKTKVSAASKPHVAPKVKS